MSEVYRRSAGAGSSRSTTTPRAPAAHAVVMTGNQAPRPAVQQTVPRSAGRERHRIASVLTVSYIYAIDGKSAASESAENVGRRRADVQVSLANARQADE